MRVTIAQLQERIKHLEAQKNEWYNKYYEIKAENDKQHSLNMARLNEEQRQVDRQVVNLMEVIRWQINPETAQSPFMPTKAERDDTRRNY